MPCETDRARAYIYLRWGWLSAAVGASSFACRNIDAPHEIVTTFVGVSDHGERNLRTQPERGRACELYATPGGGAVLEADAGESGIE